MARVWMEGFEDGIPHGYYLEGTPYSQFYDDVTMDYFPARFILDTGRNSYSQKCLKIGVTDASIVKTLDNSLPELYFRIHVKYEHSMALYSAPKIFSLIDTGATHIAYIKIDTNTLKMYIRIGGSDTLVYSTTLSSSTWYKFDLYLKIDSSSGAYTYKVNNAVVASETSINTGSNNIASVKIGSFSPEIPTWNVLSAYVDDIALNSTTGSINNSWCGDGSIVGLKPNGAGNYSDWTTSQGWTLAEDGTTTTNIEITAHGLSTNDVIYNVTRAAYRIVTKVDDNNLTVDSVTDQAEGDTIIAFTNVASLTAASGTDTEHVVIAEHNLESYDVTVNTSRSNAIRRVVYVNGTSCYNYYSNNANYTGTTVGSQTNGDTIKTFKVKQYAIADHYKTVNQASPNPMYANIQSGTSDEIDTFDMEELVADKSIPVNASIIAATLGIFAKEKGAGSKFKHVVRIGGTDYDGDEISLNDGTVQFKKVYDVSPDTSSQWTLNEIDSIECGVKVV